jgi:hypothetical protein
VSGRYNCGNHCVCLGYGPCAPGTARRDLGLYVLCVVCGFGATGLGARPTAWVSVGAIVQSRGLVVLCAFARVLCCSWSVGFCLLGLVDIVVVIHFAAGVTGTTVWHHHVMLLLLLLLLLYVMFYLCFEEVLAVILTQMGHSYHCAGTLTFQRLGLRGWSPASCAG